MTRKLIFVYYALLLLTFACGQKTEMYTEEIIDGVRHVNNYPPLWGDESRVGLEFVRKIGELEEENENYLMYRIIDVCLDKEGNLYVVDNGNRRIQVFDFQRISVYEYKIVEK